jgi:hypothetical protein
MFFVFKHPSGLGLRDLITQEGKVAIKGDFYSEECLRMWAGTLNLNPVDSFDSLVRSLNLIGWQILSLL